MKKKYRKLLSKTMKQWSKEALADSKVDIYELHLECAEQPSLFIKWAKLSALARTYKKECEAEFERIKAKYELSMRKNPADFKLKPDNKGKIMEGAFKAKIHTIQAVKDAQNEFFKAYELRNFLYDVVKSFNQRLFILQEEVLLWKNEYYSDVNMDRNDESGQVGVFRKKL